MSSILEISNKSQWNQHVGSLPASTLLIVSFHAPWAAPCAQMKNILTTLASEYPVTEPPATSWVSVNAEELSEISEQYDVTAVPFLVLLRNGQVVESVSGSSALKVRSAIEREASTTKSGATTAPAIQLSKDVRLSEPDSTDGNSKTGEPGGTDDNAKTGSDPDAQKAELFSRLANLVKAAPVMLFMKGTPSAPQCGFSRQMVGLLRERSVKYGFFNILADDDVRQGLKEYAEWPTYPQLWVDGELVGGLDIVKEEIASNSNFLGAYSVNSAAAGIET